MKKALSLFFFDCLFIWNFVYLLINNLFIMYIYIYLVCFSSYSLKKENSLCLVVLFNVSIWQFMFFSLYFFSTFHTHSFNAHSQSLTHTHAVKSHEMLIIYEIQCFEMNSYIFSIVFCWNLFCWWNYENYWNMYSTRKENRKEICLKWKKTIKK